MKEIGAIDESYKRAGSGNFNHIPLAIYISTNPSTTLGSWTVVYGVFQLFYSTDWGIL
jgi:hypothetical protein